MGIDVEDLIVGNKYIVKDISGNLVEGIGGRDIIFISYDNQFIASSIIVDPFNSQSLGYDELVVKIISIYKLVKHVNKYWLSM